MKATCKIANEDCIAGMTERVKDNSVHLTVTSIPFEELFTYSGKPEDVGNNGFGPQSGAVGLAQLVDLVGDLGHHGRLSF